MRGERRCLQRRRKLRIELKDRVTANLEWTKSAVRVK